MSGVSVSVVSVYLYLVYLMSVYHCVWCICVCVSGVWCIIVSDVCVSGRGKGEERSWSEAAAVVE